MKRNKSLTQIRLIDLPEDFYGYLTCGCLVYRHYPHSYDGKIQIKEKCKNKNTVWPHSYQINSVYPASYVMIKDMLVYPKTRSWKIYINGKEDMCKGYTIKDAFIDYFKDVIDLEYRYEDSVFKEVNHYIVYIKRDRSPKFERVDCLLYEKTD